MITQIEVPRLYENMNNVTIGQWHVAVGEQVTVGTPLVELITEKTIEDIEAPVSGTVLAIAGESRSVVPACYVLCVLGETGDTVPDVTAYNQRLLATCDEGLLFEDILQGKSSVKASSYQAAPAAKALARQLGISLDEVAEFCKRNVVHRNDVLAYAQQAKASQVESQVADSGKVALITGATGGIGGAIARKLAGRGIMLALQYCNNQARAEELRQQYPTALLFQEELTSPGAPERLVEAVIAKLGRLDILVNCAGVLQDGPLPYMSDEAWNQVLELDLTVPFKLMRAVAMEMARQRWGRIVNIVSEAGRMGAANRSNYAAAKEGLIGLTRSAALEFANLGIRVNAVSPGFVETAMTAQMPEAKRKELLKQIPVHRFARPEEIAGVVAFLCSDEADYITGQTLAVNGGLTCL